MPEIAASTWHDGLAALATGGYTYLDMLTAVDRGGQLEVVARVVDVDTAAARLVSSRIEAGAPEIASLVDVFPGADWHEREAAEMFGIRFVGHPDPRPLLTSGGEPLLIKDTPLPARVATPWPGADESSRRRARTPGVPDSWQASS